jgi:hypothetical protein
MGDGVGLIQSCGEGFFEFVLFFDVGFSEEFSDEVEGFIEL